MVAGAGSDRAFDKYHMIQPNIYSTLEQGIDGLKETTWHLLQLTKQRQHDLMVDKLIDGDAKHCICCPINLWLS